jgi:hypothetical protein
MSDETETNKQTDATVNDVSRRDVLGKAALVVGGAAASVVAPDSALARSADVSIDASGRVMMKGAVIGRPAHPGADGAIEKELQLAAQATKSPARIRIRNEWCINHRWWQSSYDGGAGRRSGRGR